MDPNFSRPVMTSYLANRTRRTSPPVRPDDDRPARPSLAATARLTAGRLLIALGQRLTGTPQVVHE